MVPTIPPAILLGLARDILRTEMSLRMEQRRSTGRETPEGVRLTQEITTLVNLGKDLDEVTAKQIIAAGRKSVEDRLGPPRMPRVTAEHVRARYPDLLSDDAQISLGEGWMVILSEALDAMKDHPVTVRVAREHRAGLHVIIGPVGDWAEAEFDFAADLSEQAREHSLQICETCGQPSAEGSWSRYRTRCADHAEVR